MKFKFLKNKEKQQRKQEKSCGRSMVEMLGVLAIIGVLSIGGIQGYTIAMRRYKTNEILNSLSKYAAVLYNSWQNEILNDPESHPLLEYDDDPTGPFEVFDMLHTAHSYSDSGLGKLPSGLKKVDDSRFIRNKSGDIIVMRAWFESKELCESAMNTLGVNREYNGYGMSDWSLCTGNDRDLIYAAPLFFIMN